MHDGLLDITNASDLVTVSWNRFLNHDKVMLIGSSDSAPADRGKLRVTLHHNLFDGIGQRAPRVRFGQVHVYNNLYRIEERRATAYSWGVGIESAIYAENNFFQVDRATSPPTSSSSASTAPPSTSTATCSKAQRAGSCSTARGLQRGERPRPRGRRRANGRRRSTRTSISPAA